MDTDLMFKVAMDEALKTNKEIIYEVSVTYNKIKATTQQILKKIYNFSKTNCVAELEDLSKSFNVVETDTIYFSPKVSNNKDDDAKLMAYNKCIDKLTGINRKLVLFEAYTSKNKSALDGCSKNCIEYLADMPEDQKLSHLKSCINDCTHSHYKSLFNLNSSMIDELKKIESLL